MEPAVVEYKYIRVNECGDVTWEDGDNRRIDLQMYAGQSVLIEDEGWNERSKHTIVSLIQDKSLSSFVDTGL